MARSGQHALHTINPVSYGILAVLFMVVDIVSAKAMSGAIETLILVISGTMFGLGLGALITGRDSGNRFVAILILTAFAALTVLSYWIKLTVS